MKDAIFAVLGNPNEGKSSVVSTLTEDERIRISDRPGETRISRPYTLQASSGERLQILDTPGFQNPRATLEWFQSYSGPEQELIPAFLKAHETRPEFEQDCELLRPLMQRSGILYVADPSRPLRELDKTEMEVLRLTGLPRMALLNRKRQRSRFEADWKAALDRRFNLVRDFQAHSAGFEQRMNLLEALGILIPDTAELLTQLRRELQEDWEQRQQQACLRIEELLQECSTLISKVALDRERPAAEQEAQLGEEHRNRLRHLEEQARKDWRDLYHHHTLPALSGQEELALEDLFSTRVWRMLGLSRIQLTAFATGTAAAAGAGLDLATGGISFGVFTAAAAISAGLATWTAAPGIGERRLPLPGFRKRKLAKEELHMGPLQEPQLLYILCDRAMAYLHRLQNWAHARRDYEQFLSDLNPGQRSSRHWSERERKVVLRWWKQQLRPGRSDPAQLSRELQTLLLHKLKLDLPEEDAS